MKIWHTITVTVETDAAEAIESALNAIGAVGTQISFPENLDGKPQKVIGYFEFQPDDESIRREIEYSLSICGTAAQCVRDVTKGILEEADWLSEWKKSWRPTQIGRFTVSPPWENIEPSAETVIRIDPGMAFGTGTHETTQLCLGAIERNYLPGESFLDVGTGTGILAIAAAKLPPYPEPSLEQPQALIRAIDIDPDAIKIARENAELNGISNRIQFSVGTISTSPAKYDFVTANLTADVIIPLLPSLLAVTNRFLVLSGILGEQRALVEAALHELGIKELAVHHLSEWISIEILKAANG